jgi:hypothetical protein
MQVLPIWLKKHVGSTSEQKLLVVHDYDTTALKLLPPLNFETGPWVAGGAPMRWLQGQPVGESDIDVFSASAEQAADVIAHLKPLSKSHNFMTTTNAITIKIDSVKWKGVIQVITRRFFDNPDMLLSEFDISACAIATDGNTFYVNDPNTITDIKNKLIRFRRYTPTSIKRFLKYQSYGFSPLPHQIQEIISSVPDNYDFSIDQGDYDGAF